MKKKFGALLVLATGALVALTGCGAPKEPEDHIWEALDEIKEAELDYKTLSVQVDDKILVINEERTFNDFLEMFPEEENFIFVNEDSNIINPEDDLIESNRNEKVYLLNEDFYSLDAEWEGWKASEIEYQPVFSLSLSNDTDSPVTYGDCKAELCDFNDGYSGAMYLSSGLPISKGAISKLEGLDYTSVEEELNEMGFQEMDSKLYNAYSTDIITTDVNNYYDPMDDLPTLGYVKEHEGEYRLYILLNKSKAVAKYDFDYNDNPSAFDGAYSYSDRLIDRMIDFSDVDKSEKIYYVVTRVAYQEITLDYDGDNGLSNSLQLATYEGKDRIDYKQLLIESKLKEHPEINIKE